MPMSTPSGRTLCWRWRNWNSPITRPSLILQSRQHPVRELLPTGQIDHLGRFIVKGIGKEEDFKSGGI